MLYSAIGRIPFIRGKQFPRMKQWASYVIRLSFRSGHSIQLRPHIMLLAVLKKLVYQQAPLLVAFKENKGPIIALAISPDGKILASGGR
jgi:hypothetical protein